MDHMSSFLSAAAEQHLARLQRIVSAERMLREYPDRCMAMRMALGMKRPALAEALGVTDDTIANRETGRHSPVGEAAVAHLEYLERAIEITHTPRARVEAIYRELYMARGGPPRIPRERTSYNECSR